MNDESRAKGETTDEIYAIGYSIDNLVGANNRSYGIRETKMYENLYQTLNTHAILSWHSHKYS